MLDAVTAALDGDKVEESSPSEPGKVEASPAPKPEAEKTAAPKEDLSDEDLKRLSQKAQKRYRELVAERKKDEGVIADLRPKAEQLDNITKQIRQTGLDQNDLAVTFDIATALKRGDLFGARALIEPIYQQVLKATGGILPEDLRRDVLEGRMPENRARELSVAKAAAEQAAYQGRVQAERRTTEAAQQFTASVVNSVNEWEQAKAATDPDWKLKQPEIMRAIEYSLLKGNRPKSVQEAIGMAERSLTEVNERLRAYRPAPRAVRAVTSGGGVSSRNTAEPKNMLDVISGVLG